MAAEIPPAVVIEPPFVIVEESVSSAIPKPPESKRHPVVELVLAVPSDMEIGCDKCVPSTNIRHVFVLLITKPISASELSWISNKWFEFAHKSDVPLNVNPAIFELTFRLFCQSDTWAVLG